MVTRLSADVGKRETLKLKTSLESVGGLGFRV